MSKQDLTEHFEGIVKEAEEHLERLKSAVAQGTRIGDSTEQRVKRLEAVCAEYRRLMRQHFSK
jgi:hypothetical protein